MTSSLSRLRRAAKRAKLQLVAQRLTAWRMRTHARLASRRLARRAMHTSSPLVGESAVVVSLTSFGERVQDVYLTVESIGAGTARPKRLILWLDDPAVFAALPPPLARQKDRGLEIYLTSNYGPHTKYYPYVRSTTDHEYPLVTADDDVIYPRYWLERLLRSYYSYPDAVSCYRAYEIQLTGTGLAPYAEWPHCRTTTPSIAHFATGVAGVLYPPAMLRQLSSLEDAFAHKTPRADDIWLHWVALTHRRPVRQLAPQPRHFPSVPGSQARALKHSNLAGGNDAQIAAVYTPDDIAALRGADVR